MCTRDDICYVFDETNTVGPVQWDYAFDKIAYFPSVTYVSFACVHAGKMCMYVQLHVLSRKEKKHDTERGH